MPSAQKLATLHQALTINLDTSTFGFSPKSALGGKVARFSRN